MDFQESNTYKNLISAYDFELQTSTQYEMFGIKARQEVLVEISYYFDTTSRNDRFIAERLRRLINGGETDTSQNLIEAAQTEENAGNNIYQEYSRVAREEGYDDLASLFSGIANIKFNHLFTFQTYSRNLSDNKLFCSNVETLWICLGCGNIMSGICAPEICPICLYPQGFYQLYDNLQ